MRRTMSDGLCRPCEASSLAGKKRATKPMPLLDCFELSHWCNPFDLPAADHLFEKRSAEICLHLPLSACYVAFLQA
jgi:hypothetical protein